MGEVGAKQAMSYAVAPSGGAMHAYTLVEVEKSTVKIGLLTSQLALVSNVLGG